MPLKIPVQQSKTAESAVKFKSTDKRKRLAGNLGAALFTVGRDAERASIQHHQFKLGDFNRKLNK